LGSLSVLFFALRFWAEDEALRCYCGGRKQCSSPIETCYYGSASVCIHVRLHNVVGQCGPPLTGCARSDACTIYDKPGNSVTCCWTDLCN
uniref:UPAR/Ly6 domain-containing protein n=1 Tax=Kryptolebias marmoratus TaxID=37003 RepID=A0A3Q3B3E6_KRYMA